MIKKFEVIRDSHTAKAGDIVYDSMMHDYGCANDDTRAFGIEYVSVSYSSDGGYPFVTVPKRDLKQI